MRPLKIFSIAVAAVFLAAAVAVAAMAAPTGTFRADWFASFMLIGLMAASYSYFEVWYDRWIKERRYGRTPPALDGVSREQEHE